MSAPSALAASANLVANVTRVLVIANDAFGGCMARLSVHPASELTLCRSGWVTFSCAGDFTDPVRTYRMLDQAQLALAANTRVYVQILDTSQHNGSCMAHRIDVVSDVARHPVSPQKPPGAPAATGRSPTAMAQ